MRRCSHEIRVEHFFGGVNAVDMTTTIRRLAVLAVVSLLGVACSSKDTVLPARDGATDQPTAGAGGATPGAGGAGGGSGGNTGAGGSLTGSGGIGSGGMVTATGGSGGILIGTGGVGSGGTVHASGGSGTGGSGSGGTVGTGGNSGGVTGTGGAGGHGGTGQGGTTWYDAGTDTSSDATQPDCPSSVPSGACSVSSSTICYYGADTRWFCKTSAKCSQGAWQVTQPLTGCTATPDPSCPADPAAPPASVCSGDAGIKATCVYPTQFCKCGFTGGPNPGWVCSKNLPAECPALPPGDGSSCTMASGVQCTYGPSCSGHDMQCVEGKWVTLQLAC
jgi:hypothetical protein